MAASDVQKRFARNKLLVTFSGRNLLIWACLPVLLYLALPIVIILPMAMTAGNILNFPPDGMSLKHFVALIGDPTWSGSAATSLKISVLATMIAMITGTSSALALYRNNFPGRGVMVAFIMMPLLVPVIVLAVGDYLFLSRMGWLGGWIPIALAHGVIITPFVFVAVQTSLSGLDPSLPRAVRSLGGGNLALLTTVYWPVLRSGLAGGGLLAFVTSFDEVVLSLFLSGPGTTTLPVQMFAAIQYDLTPKIAAVSAILVVFSIALLTVQGVFTARSKGGA